MLVLPLSLNRGWEVHCSVLMCCMDQSIGAWFPLTMVARSSLFLSTTNFGLPTNTRHSSARFLAVPGPLPPDQSPTATWQDRAPCRGLRVQATCPILPFRTRFDLPFDWKRASLSIGGTVRVETGSKGTGWHRHVSEIVGRAPHVPLRCCNVCSCVIWRMQGGTTAIHNACRWSSRCCSAWNTKVEGQTWKIPMDKPRKETWRNK